MTEKADLHHTETAEVRPISASAVPRQDHPGRSPSQFSETHDGEKNIVRDIVVRSGNEAFQNALIQEPPKPRSAIAYYLYACCIVGFLCSTINGYDGSLFNSLMQSHDFLEKFNGTNDGIWAGLVNSMYQIGSVVALPFIGPAVDTWGRRTGMFIGCFAVCIGTVILGTASFNNYSQNQFMGGRFLVGWGVAIATTAGPVYVVEVAHPAYRSILGALYNTWWFTGSILAAGVTRGSQDLPGAKSWEITIWFQLVFPGMVCLLAFFLPESPRWLYVNGKMDKAKEVLAKFHGEGRTESVWVTFQLAEYEEFLELDGADKRWWDYRALFKNRSTMNRLFCNCIVQMMGQEAGNAVLSYFQAAAFATAGFKDPKQQHDLTLGNSCQQFFFAIVGGTLVEKIGRRPLLMFSNFGCGVVWMAMCIAGGLFAASGDPPTNKAAGAATLAMQFLFGSVYSVGFTPLQALYPVEVLSFEMRAKGMAFGSLFMNLVSIFNSYVWPVALANIKWKSYIIFCVWCFVQGFITYFLIPETKNRTLEELDLIFDSPTPVKTSLQVKKAGVTSQGDVVVYDNI